MLDKCLWNYGFESHLCSFPGCDSQAKFKCETHPYEGHVCHLHRGWHRDHWLRQKAALDSRPRAQLRVAALT